MTRLSICNFIHHCKMLQCVILHFGILPLMKQINLSVQMGPHAPSRVSFIYIQFCHYHWHSKPIGYQNSTLIVNFQSLTRLINRDLESSDCRAIVPLTQETDLLAMTSFNEFIEETVCFISNSSD